MRAAWASRNDPPEGAIRRGWRDTGRLSKHWGFRTPAIVVTASFAVWGALLPAKAGGLERAALAVAGVGGALLVGLVVFAAKVLKAPLRQRDEAREALGTRTPDTDKPLEIFNKRLRGGGVLLQRLEAIVVDGGDWNEDAGRWEQETRADIEALAGPGECALFVKSAPSMRDLMRQRLEYLRDRLIPRARDGYYAYQPEKYERARLLYFLRESMETAAYLRAEVKRESPDTGELAKQVAKWALNTRTLLPPARRAEFDAGLVWPEGDRLTSLQRALDSGMAVLRTMQEQLGEANRGGVVPAVALRAA